MTDKEMAEWSKEMWASAGKMAAQAVAIYGILLGAYWIFVG